MCLIIWPIKSFLSYLIQFIYSRALRTFNLSLVGQKNSNRMICHSYFKKSFCWFRYSTTVTFPLATFPDIFHPFFLILKSAESVLSHFPFWPASPVLLYIFHVFDTKWWFYFWGSILIFVHLIFFKKRYLWFFILYLLCSRYIWIIIVCIFFCLTYREKNLSRYREKLLKFKAEKAENVQPFCNH